MDGLAEEMASREIVDSWDILDSCSVHNADDITEACKMFGGTSISYRPTPQC
jgi:hypothetical protein